MAPCLLHLSAPFFSRVADSLQLHSPCTGYGDEDAAAHGLRSPYAGLVVAKDSDDRSSGKASGGHDDKGDKGDAILGVPRDRLTNYAIGGTAVLIVEIVLVLLVGMVRRCRRELPQALRTVPVVINHLQQPPAAKLGHVGHGDNVTNVYNVVRGQEVPTRDVESGHAPQTLQELPEHNVYPSPPGPLPFHESGGFAASD
jgi:hypothetical protein